MLPQIDAVLAVFAGTGTEGLQHPDADKILEIRQRTGLTILVVARSPKQLALLAGVPALMLFAEGGRGSGMMGIADLPRVLEMNEIGKPRPEGILPSSVTLIPSGAVPLLPEHMAPETKRWLLEANRTGSQVVFRGAVLKIKADTEIPDGGSGNVRTLICVEEIAAALTKLPQHAFLTQFYEAMYRVVQETAFA
jgi:hypothetical protein